VKLEHLPAAPDGHDELIRLFNFDAREAAALMAVVSDWLRDPSGPLQLDTLPFIFNVNCSVRSVVADKDEGIWAIGAGAFECRSRIASIEWMLNLMEPFSKEATGYQWLYDLDTPIELLFSPMGAW
jgi:hypothetical protein